jgi:hypothetical protein
MGYAPDKIDYFSDKSLSACLIVCGDKGRLAFMEAETGLMFVNRASKQASHKVGNSSSEIPKVASYKIAGCRYH